MTKLMQMRKRISLEVEKNQKLAKEGRRLLKKTSILLGQLGQVVVEAKVIRVKAQAIQGKVKDNVVQFRTVTVKMKKEA